MRGRATPGYGRAVAGRSPTTTMTARRAARSACRSARWRPSPTRTTTARRRGPPVGGAGPPGGPGPRGGRRRRAAAARAGREPASAAGDRLVDADGLARDRRPAEAVDDAAAPGPPHLGGARRVGEQRVHRGG